MERKGPDQPDLKPGFENPEVDPSEQASLSGEKWQTIFRNLYRRTDAAPDRKDHIEQEYELRHEHKDVSATTGHHLGSVVTGTLGSDQTPASPAEPPPADGRQPAAKPQPTDSSGLPNYQEPPAGGGRAILSWIIVVILLAAIIALLSLLF